MGPGRIQTLSTNLFFHTDNMKKNVSYNHWQHWGCQLLPSFSLSGLLLKCILYYFLHAYKICCSHSLSRHPLLSSCPVFLNILHSICVAHILVTWGHPPEHGWLSLPLMLSVVSSSSARGGSMWAPLSYMLQCCLAWSYAGLVQRAQLLWVHKCSGPFKSRDTLLLRSPPDLWLLQSFCFLLCNVSWDLRG